MQAKEDGVPAHGLPSTPDLRQRSHQEMVFGAFVLQTMEDQVTVGTLATCLHDLTAGSGSGTEFMTARIPPLTSSQQRGLRAHCRHSRALVRSSSTSSWVVVRRVRW